PASPEDYLFSGYERGLHDPRLGLADLNEGILRRDSPLGRALRAIVWTNLAMDSGQRQDVEEALADANAARGMLPLNPLVLSVSVKARVIAAGIYQEAKLMEQRTAVLQEAARDVQALAACIDLVHPTEAVWLFWEVSGDRLTALDVARSWLERSG